MQAAAGRGPREGWRNLAVGVPRLPSSLGELQSQDLILMGRGPATLQRPVCLLVRTVTSFLPNAFAETPGIMFHQVWEPVAQPSPHGKSASEPTGSESRCTAWPQEHTPGGGRAAGGGGEEARAGLCALLGARAEAGGKLRTWGWAHLHTEAGAWGVEVVPTWGGELREDVPGPLLQSSARSSGSTGRSPC